MVNIGTDLRWIGHTRHFINGKYFRITCQIQRLLKLPVHLLQPADALPVAVLLFLRQR
ncbi:hypothetical protein D3C71_1679000 [compost metagenome]